MGNLVITPFDTKVPPETLEELAIHLAGTFRGIYSAVSVGQPSPPYRGELIEWKDLRGIRIRTYQPKREVDWVQYLQEQHGEEDVLAVTDYHLLEQLGLSLLPSLGLTYRTFRKAIVSTADFKNGKPNKILDRLKPLALHELGHLHQLGHHQVKKDNGKYCPMTLFRELQEAHPYLSLLEVYDLRAPQYCESCTVSLQSQKQ